MRSSRQLYFDLQKPTSSEINLDFLILSRWIGVTHTFAGWLSLSTRPRAEELQYNHPVTSLESEMFTCPHLPGPDEHRVEEGRDGGGGGVFYRCPNRQNIAPASDGKVKEVS